MSKKKRLFKILLFSIILVYQASNTEKIKAEESFTKEQVVRVIEDMYIHKSEALIDGDLEFIKTMYGTDSVYGQWAYEYEVRKAKYIKNWGEKQGVNFVEISPKVIVKKVSGGDCNYSAYFICCTDYKYVYENEPDIINSSKIGTAHSINLSYKDGSWKITKEWYKDPFADSLSMDNIKAADIKEYIQAQNARDFSSLVKRRLDAVEYADKYCGAASEEQHKYTYNKKYRDYNPMGGDCANFASQILFEGGKFRKNTTWNYDGKGATRAWLNADGFKNYMVGSGRASLIAYGSYDKVYKAAYKLLPGDFVAYEKKGDITHISMVTGADSKGYTLVSCHNTDRSRVPWDLGWSDKSIRFWLVRVHY